MTSSPRIAVCIPTRERNELLGELLDSIARSDLDGFNCEVIVADNSDDHGARPVVYARIADFPVPLRLVHEPHGGLARIRNRLIHEASESGSQYVAFVDDDQTVDACWLRAALNMAVDRECAVVVSRCNPEFRGQIPAGIRASRYFDDRHQPDCDGWLEYFNTGGSLINIRVLEALGVEFRQQRDISGGEDSLMSAELSAKQQRFAFAADSIVWEVIEPSRASLKWIARREFRNGVNAATELFILDHSFVSRLKLCVKGIVLIARGLVRFTGLLFAKSSMGVWGVSDCSRGMGMFVGLVTRREVLSEYRQLR